jgi:hypothetical protein
MVCGDWRARGPPFSRGPPQKESVMAGLDPAIHVFGRSKSKDMDAREFFLEDALRAFARDHEELRTAVRHFFSLKFTFRL